MDVYKTIRDLFSHTDMHKLAAEAAARAAAGDTASHPAEGSLAVQGFSVLRGFVGTVLPSRMYADMVIGLILIALTIILAISVISGCQQLGCAFIKLGFLCCALFAVVFWLYVVWQLSDQEFHGSYIKTGEWVLESLRGSGGVKNK